MKVKSIKLKMQSYLKSLVVPFIKQVDAKRSAGCGFLTLFSDLYCIENGGA